MKKYSVLKQRVREYARHKGVGLKAIYQQAQMTDGTLSNASGLGEYNLLKFLAYAQDLNLHWFFWGEGPITHTQQPPQAWEARMEALERRLQAQEERLRLLNEELDDQALLELIKTAPQKKAPQKTS